VVTGAIVALIGLNLAPVAKDGFAADPLVALVTLLVVVLVTVASRGLLGRVSIVLGVLVGYALAGLRGDVDWSGVREASWVGLPDFIGPSFQADAIVLFLPVVLVLVAENTGHVKAVAAMTDRPLDDVMGRAYAGDGIATVVAGLGGGSGTTTYAENIGVMAATRIYSTAPYYVAAALAILLGLSPKVGEVVAAIPEGRAGRRHHRAVRPHRRAGRAHLGGVARRLPRSGEPADGGPGSGHRGGQLRVHAGRLHLRGHRHRLGRVRRRLPGHAAAAAPRTADPTGTSPSDVPTADVRRERPRP
jgi:hypothetical protein